MAETPTISFIIINDFYRRKKNNKSSVCVLGELLISVVTSIQPAELTRSGTILAF